MKRFLKVATLAFVGLIALTGCNSVEKPGYSEAYSREGSIVFVPKEPGGSMNYSKADVALVNKDNTLSILDCSTDPDKDKTCITQDGRVLVELDWYKPPRGAGYLDGGYKTTLGDKVFLDCWDPEYDVYICMDRNYVFNYEEDRKLEKENQNK